MRRAEPQVVSSSNQVSGTIARFASRRPGGISGIMGIGFRVNEQSGAAGGELVEPGFGKDCAFLRAAVWVTFRELWESVSGECASESGFGKDCTFCEQPSGRH